MDRRVNLRSYREYMYQMAAILCALQCVRNKNVKSGRKERNRVTIASNKGDTAARDAELQGGRKFQETVCRFAKYSVSASSGVKCVPCPSWRARILSDAWLGPSLYLSLNQWNGNIEYWDERFVTWASLLGWNVFIRRLTLFRNLDRFRILICGGDGSIGWVMNEVDQMKMSSQVSRDARVWRCCLFRAELGSCYASDAPTNKTIWSCSESSPWSPLLVCRSPVSFPSSHSSISISGPASFMNFA